MKKRIGLLLVVAACIFTVNIDVKALTSYTVKNVTEYFDKIEEISNSSNEEFRIELDGDIIINDSSQVKKNNTINNGNTVTIIGNGHTIRCELDSNCRLKASGGNINLGEEGKTNELYIEGMGDTADTFESLLFVSNGTVKMYEGTVLQNNKAKVAGLSGGAIEIGSNGKVEMNGGIIQKNSANGSGVGGAILVYSNGVFTMNGGVIKDNATATDETLTTADSWGGAMYVESGTVTLNKGTISGNKASYGGAIGITNGSLTIKDVIFKDNKGYVGGAIIAYLAPLSIDGATFIGNSATEGGALNNYYASSFSVKNSIFDGNEATNGGAIINAYGTVNSENNTFINNKATNGGAIYSNSTAVISKNDIITKNSATNGGGVFATTGKIDFLESDVYNNKATAKGNDFSLESGVGTKSIKNPTTMTGYATYDGANVNLKNWYKDNNGNRYSLSNVTDVVLYDALAAGTEYNLTVAGDKVYIINFESNEGTEVDYEMLNVGDKVTKPTDPTRNGFKFVGWYKNQDLTEEFDFDSDVDSDLTLFAKWKENGSDSSDDSSESDTVNPNTADNVVFYITLLTLSVIGVIAGIVFLKKRKVNNK